MNPQIATVVYVAGILGLFVLDRERIANGHQCGSRNERTRLHSLLATKVASHQCEPSASNDRAPLLRSK